MHLHKLGNWLKIEVCKKLKCKKHQTAQNSVQGCLFSSFQNSSDSMAETNNREKSAALLKGRPVELHDTPIEVQEVSPPFLVPPLTQPLLRQLTSHC